MTSGTNLHSRYHPAYSPKENLSSGSNKPYLCNGRTRTPLLTNLRLQSRLRNQIAKPYRTGSHQPPALWSFKDKASFPSMSFCICVSILNHKTPLLSIETNCFFPSCTLLTKHSAVWGKLFAKKTLDFLPWTW